MVIIRRVPPEPSGYVGDCMLRLDKVMSYASAKVMAHIKKKMKEAGLFAKWTTQLLLDELDIIEELRAPDGRRILGEVTEKQKSLYKAPGVEPPSL